VEASSAAVEKASLLITAKRFDDAIKTLAEVPDDGDARYLTALAYAGKDDYRHALREIERCIAMMPDVPEPHAIRSDILYRMGRERQSLKAALEAARLAPQEPLFQVSLARSAWAVKDWKLAEQAAATAVELAPDMAEAHVIKGLVDASRRRRESSREHFDMALALDPAAATILNDIAISAPHLAIKTESVKLLEEAVRLDPSNSLIADNLYNYASMLVRGQGFDRFELMIWAPFAIAFALNALIFFGWVHTPPIVAAGALALLLITAVIVLVGDTARNVMHYRGLKPGTRALYRRRFQRDHWLSYAYFVVTFGVPALAVGILDSAIGLPAWAQWLGLFAVIVVWAVYGPRMWRQRVHPWLVRAR
jgi:tetratricopeptide (TPR) repeat protein